MDFLRGVALPCSLVYLSLLLIALCWCALGWSSNYGRRRRRLPPGNTGFPLVGETLQLMAAYKSENPEPFIEERVRRFGSVFRTHVFGEPTVFSADPEANRFILQNEGKLFKCSYPGSISHLLGKHSLLLLEGRHHKKMHSFTMSFVNSSAIRDHAFMDIDRLIRANMGSWADRILLMEEAKKITFELTIKQLMSLDPCEWTEKLRKKYVLVIDGFFALPLPLFSTAYGKAIKARREVAEELGKVVRERRVSEGKKDDMLGALLAGKDVHSDEEIVDFMLALLVAGYETTSTTITLAVKFLTDTPEALARLQEEQNSIMETFRKGKKLDWEDYKSMHFTQCVVNETLRIANIISGVFRRTLTDVDIKGYTIPMGWKVFASFRAVNMDSRHFHDSRSFNPWRWQNEGGAGGTWKNVFMPFGGGPRLCPGYELARVVVSIFLHNLVTGFSWTPAEEDKLVFFPTTRTLKRYPINLHRRRAFARPAA